MKNCELFKTEKELQEKWGFFSALPEIPRGTTFTQWACFKDADLALQDKFMKPRLFRYVSSTRNEYALVLGPRLDKWNNCSLVYVDYISASGNRSFDHVDHFKECDIPTEIINIAKAMVVEEMKHKCPLMVGKENA
jgi:hypothetical protein